MKLACRMELPFVMLAWGCPAVVAQSPSKGPAVVDVLHKATHSAKSALDGNVKKETFPLLAELWVAADPAAAAAQIQDLVKAAGGFVDGMKRATVMTKLARFQAMAGDRAGALATLDRARHDADGAMFVVTSEYWTYFWSEMAGPPVIATRTYARDDLVADMKEIRDEIEGNGRTARVVRRADLVNAPSAPASNVQKDAQTEDALREIARIGRKEGSWNEAERAIKLVKSPLSRVDLMCRAAESASRASDAKLTTTAYESAKSESSKMNIFAPKDRTAAFVRLAASMTSTGKTAQARKVTGNLWDAKARGRLKRLIAYAETIRGDGNGALKWVESEWVADARAYGLIGIAEALLGKGYPPVIAE